MYISKSFLLSFTILILCRKSLSQSGLTDCNIITIEGEEMFFSEEPIMLSMF
jgi:hypothetical protein